MYKLRYIPVFVLAALLPTLMGPTGGFPSRPKFLSVGVNTAAPAGNGNLTATGTITAATFSGALSGNGSAITNLNASNLASGTVPDARFPATLPALSGVNLTALNATQLTSGTLPSARLSGTYSSALTLSSASNVFTGNGAAITNVNAATLGGVALSGVCQTGGTGCPASASPGGSNTQVQFNDSGAFGGNAGLTFDKSTVALTLTGNQTLLAAAPTLTLRNNSGTTGPVTQYIHTGSTVQAIVGVSNTSGGFIAGSTAGDFILRVNNGRALLSTDNGATGGDIAACSTGTFTGTLTGMTGSVTGTVTYRMCGSKVDLYQAGSSMSGTSNSTAMTMTGIPAAIQPSGANDQCGPMTRIQDNSVGGQGGEACVTGGSGTITFARCAVSGANVICNSAFTNSGSKGLGLGWKISYERNTA